MGLIEVVRELPRIRGILSRLVKEAARRQPKVAVLVDSPDFNLRLAARLRRQGVAVVLYVSPQLWAWRRGRVRVVRRLAQEVLCILPFEQSFYEQHGVRARYVGHPLVDDLANEGLLNHELPRVVGRLGLLPGSRAMEIGQLLPVMIEAIRRMSSAEIAEVVLVEAPGVGPAVDQVLDRCGTDERIRRVSGAARRTELAACSLAWTASGTATVECALLDVPMVVGYRLQPLSAMLARMLVRVPHVALANLIAGQRAAPELLQEDWCSGRLTAVSRSLLDSGAAEQRRALAAVRQKLGAPGASQRAADAVREYLL
jgi:lipid-A-disaccharide synthase